MDDLLGSLTPAQRRAVAIVEACLDAYNTKDGVGLFAGPGRYGALEDRLTIAAVQSRDLFGLWGTLLRRMRWPTPPKAMDARVLALLEHNDSAGVLASMATHAASIVMLARAMHDKNKAARRALRAVDDDAGVAVDDELNDNLSF